MITKINSLKKVIKDDNSYYYVIYFDYPNHQNAFTYLSLKSIIYFKKRGLKKITKDMQINVFKVKNTKYYKIISFIDGEGITI